MENNSSKSRITKYYFELIGDIVKDYTHSSNLIIQQNNCVSRNLHPYSFSWNIARKFKYANPYSQRLSGPYKNLCDIIYRPKLGTVQIIVPPMGQHGPSFACFYSQYRMGKPNTKYYITSPKTDSNYIFLSTYKDTYSHRLEYFKICLNNLLNILLTLPNITSVIFPKYIGCGLAGGNWELYEKCISNFSEQLNQYCPNIDVYVIEKE